jgi:hypothetical protein
MHGAFWGGKRIESKAEDIEKCHLNKVNFNVTEAFPVFILP